ncbi:MAG TPA: hypothetical protein VN578_14640 [Candidatus Binatia bacterium]|nr:hypothetical protein [Candidatus Binatia bacterium]
MRRLRHGAGVSLNQIKPTPNLGVSEHFGTQINAVTLDPLSQQLGHDQALARTNHQCGLVDVVYNSTDAWQIEIAVFNL